MKKKEPTAEFNTEMIGREAGVAYVMSRVAEAECCSVVGVSNVGKSTLLRSLLLPAVQKRHLGAKAADFTFVYVDLNLMLQMTEQGFYEVILRNALAAFQPRLVDDGVSSAMSHAYQTVIAPGSQFSVPLAFEDGLQAVGSRTQGMFVLLLDEFDEVFAELEPRVFVRLRALKDKYWPRLCYVTATDHPVSEIRRERQAGEFAELFQARTYHLAPLGDMEARALAQQGAAQSKVNLTAEDVQFVVECAGGHPSLLLVTCHALAKSREEAILRPTEAGYGRIRERLDSDASVRLECAKLWADLNATEHESLMTLLSGQGSPPDVSSLIEKGLVLATGASPKVFSSLFGGFVQRQRLMRRREPRGVRIDVEAGDVWVDGTLAPVLTDLEYKLLLLLYGNLDKICDKYKVVETVWGESYIDEVDDARIEKLVSRLRQKVEAVPDDPKYLITVRGRGYKLVSPD